MNVSHRKINDEEVKLKLNSIEEAITDIKNGKLVIVVDDEDRENEGDFICAAEKVTPDIINFMSKYGRGLICTPITENLAQKFELNRMVQQNTDALRTAFTVSIDYKREGCTTGISAYDRSTGIRALLKEGTVADDFSRPGHIFPLIAKPGGVLKRTGHTEAAVDLAVLAGFEPAGVLVEILNDDGTMARLPQLVELAKKYDLKIISIEDLVAYRMKSETLIEIVKRFPFQTAFGEFTAHIFKDTTENNDHIALTMGEWDEGDVVLTRVHSGSNAEDLIELLSKGETSTVVKSMKHIAQEGKGVLLLYRHQEKENEFDNIFTHTQSVNHLGFSSPYYHRKETSQQLDFGIGAQILHHLGVRKMRLLTSTDRKRIGLVGYDLEIVENKLIT